MLTDNEKFLAHYVSIKLVRDDSNVLPERAANTLCILKDARARHVTNDEAWKLSNSADQHLTTIFQPETALPQYWEELEQLTEREQFVVEFVAVYATGTIKNIPHTRFQEGVAKTIKKFIETHGLTSKECNDIGEELLDEFFIADGFLKSLRPNTRFEQIKGRHTRLDDSDSQWGV